MMSMLDKEYITTHIRPYFSNTIVKRGWNYYLDRVVRNLTKKEMGYEAIVKGTISYRVRINLFEFSSSSCTCPFDDYCKHMAAVIFEALDTEGLPPIEFLHPNVVRKANQIQSPTIIGPKESDSVEEWHQFFHSKVNEKMSRSLPSFDSYYLLGRTELDPFCKNWTSTRQWMFRLHVWLFLMNRIEEMYGRENEYLYFYDSLSFHRKKAMDWFSGLIEIVSHLDKAELRDQCEPFLLSTMNYLTQNAFHVEQTITDWSRVYGYLWNRLFLYLPWMQKEMQRLRVELAKPQPSEFRRDALIKALLYFEILSGNDQQAMELANSLHSQELTWCFPHLNSFSQHEEWSRLVKWLTWMKPMIKNANRGVLNNYLDLWEKVGRSNLLYDDEWEQTLVYLLPASAIDYARYLMGRGKYQQWVDLHLFYETSLMDLNAGDLKEIEAHNRRLLLPLYHQVAERYILEKNRDSYKRAVKLLKKLKTHYKKLKDESRWELYMETLSANYKRYRAFQEELQKGKLIP
jgi:hypothetical protein